MTKEREFYLKYLVDYWIKEKRIETARFWHKCLSDEGISYRDEVFDE